MIKSSQINSLAEAHNCGVQDVFVSSFCWCHKIPVDNLGIEDEVLIERDFSAYLNTIFPEEAVPYYVMAYVRDYELNNKEA